MAQAKKGRLNYRCPSCFMRDIDIDLFFDTQKNEYYCLRCQFFGFEQDIIRLNEVARFRYKMIDKRIMKFNDDKEE